ncbi:PQ-loop repeat-containing protein [Phanerochaete sordida]|uniref:PQ-loop repeat-containing protein n=1 Tax=Phanerochaete sordida TaxID=48140 RepID=A0A9P3G597_9APHY|nr:PQ-loop repeat-containing protein [Phanerochaete sordida]
MPDNAVAENVLGTLGTVCWMVQLLPQVWKSWREKSTEGLSDYLVLLWSIAAWFLGVYAIVQDLNVPLIIQPQIFGFLTLLSWAQCQYYGRKRPLKVCVTLFATIMLCQAGFEVGMVYAVRPSFRAGNIRGTQFFGIMASVLLSLGLFPQYYEIYRYREVIGISIPFMMIDLLGGVFSALSLVFKPKFDVIAGVAYSLVVVLDGIVILLALILNPLARRRRQRAAAAFPTEEVPVSEASMNTVHDVAE